MSAYKVKYSDFNPANIVFGKTDEANATGQDGKPIKYFRIPIQYNYEVTTSDGRKTFVKSGLYIEGPKENSRGPQSKVYPEKGNKVVHSIFTKYDLTNPEQYSFINRDDVNPGTIHKLCLKCCEEVFNRKGELQVSCRILDSMQDLLHYPVKWTLGNDGRPTGENPAAIWKLFRYGKDYTRETDFILPVNGGQKIAWDMISNSRIQHQPVIKVDNITIAGGRPSIKMEVASSVVFDIMSSTGPKLQEDTIAEAAKDTYVTAKLLDKIKELESALAKGNVNDSTPESVTEAAPAPVVIPGIVTQAVAAPAPAPVMIPMPPAPAPIVVETPVVVAPEPVIIPAPVIIPVAAPVPAPEPVTLASVINSGPVMIPPPVLPPVLPGGLVIPPLP
jgi:hypothetical protein